MLDIHQTYRGNNFMMYVSQIIMLYVLNLYNAAVGGNVNWYSHYGEQYGGFLKN